MTQETQATVEKIVPQVLESSMNGVRDGIIAKEDGDTIRFERPGPFGTYKWQKKKSELADDERAAWEQSREKDKAAAKAKQE